MCFRPRLEEVGDVFRIDARRRNVLPIIGPDDHLERVAVMARDGIDERVGCGLGRGIGGLPECY